MIKYRSNFIKEEQELWLRAPLWYQMPYSQFVEEVLPNMEETAQELAEKAVSSGVAPVERSPYEAPEEFVAMLKENLQHQLQPGMSLSPHLPVLDEPDNFLSGMPADMSQHIQSTWSRKLHVADSLPDLERELMKRMRVSDIKFFLTKANLSVGGSKLQLLQRLLQWKIPAIQHWTAESTRTDHNNPLSAHVACLWLRLLRTEAIEPLAKLFYVQLRSSLEAAASAAAQKAADSAAATA